jgi:hypothetical protein
VGDQVTVQADDAVGEFVNHADIVGYHHDGHAVLAVQAVDGRIEVAQALDIDAAGRLVEKEDARAVQKGMRQQNALQLPPGELADQFAPEFLHPGFLQHAAGGKFLRPPAGQADEFLDGQREGAVESESLRHVAHLRQDLAHRPGKEADLALEGDQAEDRLQQGGLS